LRRLLAAVVLSWACVPSHAPTVIIGATAVAEKGNIADSVIVVDGPSIATIGTRIDTPVPKGARIVDGRGAWAVAEDRKLAVGGPADFVLVGAEPKPGAPLPAPRAVVRAGRYEVTTP
jgi:cytosine/adenosine deaminase-related metal-dependent hydrolase